MESFVWQLARMKSRSCPCSLSRRFSCDRVTQIDLAEVDCTNPQSIFSSLHGGVASVYGYGEECASAPRGCGSRMLFAECDQARWTLSRSRPPLRLLRTGEHDEKLMKSHHLALSAALNVLAPERADYTGVKVQGGSLESATVIVWEPRGSVTPDKCEPCPLGTSSRSGATARTECLHGMFNDYGILESVSCQLGFFSDGVEPKMCQQRTLGSHVEG